MNENQNLQESQAESQFDNFENSPKKPSGKNIRAIIAAALACLLLVISFVAALCRISSGDSESFNSSESEAGINSAFEDASDISEESEEESIEYESSEAEYFPAINVVTPEGVTAAAIFEADSLYCIYEKDSEAKRSIASITKLITASVAVRYMPVETMITVGSELELVKPDSSVCGLRSGYRLTLEQLLYGLLMSSGNDAAYTIAVNVARHQSGNAEMSDSEAVEYFCGLMNELAKEIGATDSSFANPEGWDDENNYSTVQDLAIIARYAKSQALIAKIASTVSYTTPIASGGAMTFNNSNFLLHEEGRFYHPDVTGLKTGSTSGAGKCLVATVNIDGHDYIAIVMGCPNEETRYTSMLSLITYIEEYDNLKFA